MQKRRTNQALRPARVVLTAEGLEFGVFTEVEGLDMELEVVDYTESGGDPRVVRRPPDTRTPPTVILKRARTNDARLSVWHQAVARGHSTDRKNCTLTMYGTSGRPVATYHLESAWPSKVEIGGLKDGSGQIREAVTLSCRRIRRLPK